MPRSNADPGVTVTTRVLAILGSFDAGHRSLTLTEVAQMIRLRGAETVIVGIQPEVAFAMVELGLTLEGMETALDLEEGLALLNARISGGADRVQ